MNDLLILVKVISAIYQAKKIGDKDLATEVYETYKNLPPPEAELYEAERELRSTVRSIINWLYSQTEEEAVIKSLLEQRLVNLGKDAEDISKGIRSGIMDYGDEVTTRKVIYKHMSEIRLALEGEAFTKKFKREVKKFFYKDFEDIEKTEWIELLDLVQEKVNSNYEDRQSEIIISVNTKDPSSFIETIEQAKRESDSESILKTGIRGMNECLNPDGGFRRGKAYLFEALTNRGKSLTLAHVLASFGMYNKPVLRDATKIPTLLLESGEDTMDLIVIRMYKLALSVKGDRETDFRNEETESIVDTIVQCFRENGWYLVINQIDPSQDNPTAMFARARRLMLEGCEIVAWLYDYLALQDITSVPGDTRSDKLQVQSRQVRAFCNSRGICFITATQLSPMAKQRLVESDDESEVYFAKEVAGKSLTEGSTKITNEYDVVITIHVAKTNMKSYFTYCLGKMRGNETCKPEERFGIYDLDPDLGLIHDIKTKPGYRRSLSSMRNADGQLEDTWDAI